MAVKVTTTEVSAGTSTYTVVTHDDGVDFLIDDGHLMVFDKAGDRAAGYAPATWRSAVVADSQ
ncbi:hypothetical protein GUY44_07090 [Pimelobacter simplex]|uniref:Uncharacterized protein n=1 Tax=Nocardioides simplex TaxID=2045 RepID=A0A0A1DK31_NOCSI|nr:hypothetical protein [Pimelobacter simplex]AIY17771.1 hypothetical protein KR76_15185 [Pimelobacter simplex]MCG8150237.1 hypothetical protein [Pimelobacter simplex]GEB13553.1 hypothetical protein NSI01_18680 [Pimelobacter simplex]SFM71793.1 hypothetical protein SAMN05421671_3118 [Pimelobacter simplex]